MPEQMLWSSKKLHIYFNENISRIKKKIHAHSTLISLFHSIKFLPYRNLLLIYNRDMIELKKRPIKDIRGRMNCSIVKNRNKTVCSVGRKLVNRENGKVMRLEQKSPEGRIIDIGTLFATFCRQKIFFFFTSICLTRWSTYNAYYARFISRTEKTLL